MWTNNIGIDLGTATTMIYAAGRGVMLKEPSVVAIDARTGKQIAIGGEAYRMLGRTHKGIKALYPLQDGVISDYDLAASMMQAFLHKVCGYKLMMPRVVVCIPSQVTEVEKRALQKAILSAGASKVCPIEEPVAAAIGAGIDIAAPHGSLIVDIGAGTTDIAVLSLHGVAVCVSLKTAGGTFDAALIRYLRHKYNLLVGERMAEQIKMEIGCVFEPDASHAAFAKGRNFITGLPQSITLTEEDMVEALTEPALVILSAVRSVLEQTPPEMIGDIYNDGIFLTGGGARLRGLDRLISDNTGLRVQVPEDPELCVVKGTGLATGFIDVLEGGRYAYRTVIDLR